MTTGVVVAVASILTGVANLGLLEYLRRIPDRPGLGWFEAVIACQAVFCLSYGTGLLLGDHWLRVPLLMAFWLGAIWIGIAYLAFALDYTGRGAYITSWSFRGVLGVQALASVIVLTYPLHDLGPSDVAYVDYAGVVVADYAHNWFVVFEFLVVVSLAAIGVVLLLDTVLSYGPLYRKHAFAIAITPIPPILAFVAWLLDIGTLTPLNLTPIAFFPHLLLDLYALFGEDMFEFPPATRRTAERAAIDDLGNPVVVVDPDDRIVRLNPAATEALGVPQSAALTTSLSSFLEPAADDIDTDHVRVRDDPEGRLYSRTRNELVDGTGTVVGYTDVFQDVTADRRREQRVAVLNRVLRHNLRNDLNVVHGSITAAAARIDDDTAADLLETAAAQTAELSALGERAREIDTTMSRSDSDDRFEPASVLSTVADRLRENYPNGTITVTVPVDLTLSGDPEIFAIVFENLMENGLRHDPTDPEVIVSTDEAATWTDPGDPPTGATAATNVPNGDGNRRTVTFGIEDTGPGIPEHELDVLDAASESALEHGSGLGLWVANWGVTTLGGDLAFEPRNGGGTRALVRLPVA